LKSGLNTLSEQRRRTLRLIRPTVHPLKLELTGTLLKN
jgi:hypothetical protein